ncbi:MAG: hypothetical protein HY678_07185 [Chloroflexi bacterium]|nr:hypothetical protein [Chloroflexota bacterium]
MRRPPRFRDVDPAGLSLPELISLHEELGAWIEEALAARAGDAAPDDDLYDAVYGALARLSRERVLRQQGEIRGH